MSEWLAERGIMIDQSTIYRWVQRYLPLFGDAARRYRRPAGADWRVHEALFLQYAFDRWMRKELPDLMFIA